MGKYLCQDCEHSYAGWCGLGNDYPVRRCDDYVECDDDYDDDDYDDDDDDVDMSKECFRCGNDAYWNGDCYECDECGNTFQ